MSRKITTVIVEDSRLARNELKELIRGFEELQLLGEAENADDGVALIRKTRPDLLFLDIHMPEKDGFELLEMLDEVPITVFTTAYDEYAIKSFEYNALDYLLKPVNENRFHQTIEKVKRRIVERRSPQEQGGERLDNQSQIFIKDGEKCWLIRIGEISHFEIVGNYSRVYFKGEKPLLYKSLNQVEEKLPRHNFFRANRQQIINTHFVREVQPWFKGKLKIIMADGSEILVSRRQSYLFKDQLSL